MFMLSLGQFRLFPSCVLWGCVIAAPSLWHSLSLFCQLAGLLSAVAWGFINWRVNQLQLVQQSTDQRMWRISIDGQERSLISDGCLARFAIAAWTDPVIYRQQLINTLYGLLRMCAEMAVYLPVALFWCLLVGGVLVKANPFDLLDGAYQLVTIQDPALVLAALGSASFIIGLFQVSRLLADPAVYGFKNCFWLHQQRAICQFASPRATGVIDLFPIPHSRPEAGDFTSRIVS